VLSNGHAGFGGRSGETHQRKRRQGAPGRPNIAEGKTHKEALRSLKRRISNAIYARLQADAQSAASAAATGPGGQPGNDSDSSAADSHPERQLFGQATPEPATATLRRATPRRLPTLARPTAKKIRQTS
jgi:hypothetical protein